MFNQYGVIPINPAKCKFVKINQAKHFIDCVYNDVKPTVDIEDSIKTQKIIDLAKKLSETAQVSLANDNEEMGKRIELDLEKIIEQEQVCQEKLSLVKNGLLEKMKAVKKGQTLLKGYGLSQRIKPKISKNV